MTNGGWYFYKDFICVIYVHANSLFIIESDKMFKCFYFGTQSFLSFESLGHLVKTEYMLNHVIECEVCVWHLMGILFMDISLGTLHLAVFHSVLKGNTTEFYIRFMRLPCVTMANHSGLMKTPRTEPSSYKWQFWSLSQSLIFKVTLMCSCIEIEIWKWELWKYEQI